MGIALLIIGILVIIGGGVALFSGAVNQSAGPKIGGTFAALTGAAMILLSCMSPVGARAIGIETSMGKYRDTLHSGMNWTAPWASVEEWTTRNQTLRFAGDKDTDDRDNYVTQPQITVRLGNQSIAYVDVTVTWTVGDDEAGIRSLWQQYKTFEDMRQDFAVPTALGATNSAFDGYNPFAGLDEKTADNPYVPLTEWSQKIHNALDRLYSARGIHLVNVQVTQVHYDQRTEDKLRQFADAVANTRIAAQNVKTAEQDALASKTRKEQSGNDCISLIRDLAAQDKLKDLPAGTNVCGGTGTPVIVGGK